MTWPFDRAEFEVAQGACLKDLLDGLVTRFGGEWLNGILMVNSQVVYEDQFAKIRLRDGDEVLLLPPVSGG